MATPDFWWAAKLAQKQQLAPKRRQLTIEFEVEDTGSGIAPEEIDKIFEPFGQSETGRNSQQGTGLGLPISHAFVRLMGGNITAESNVALANALRNLIDNFRLNKIMDLTQQAKS